MRNVITAVVFLVLASVVYGQDKPRDNTVDPDAFRAAQERLNAKANDRNAERATKVEITAGELDDLRERVKQLEAEVATLRGGTTKPVVKRNPTKIELGMTKAEVERFVKSKLGTLRIAESSARAEVGGAREKMRIEKLSKVREQTGTQGSLFGQSRAAYGMVDHVDGEINVVFENSVVTSVSGQ